MLYKISKIILSSYSDKLLVLLFILGLLLAYIISKFVSKSNNSFCKILFTKIFLLLGIFICLFSGILDIYIKNIYNIKGEELLITTTAFICGMILAMQGVFLFIFGNIKSPKPDKYLLNEYQEIYREENLKIYKKVIKKNKHYIIDFKTEEFTENIYNDLYDNKMVPIMEKDLKEMQNRMYRSLYVTYIISVDRITSYFNSFIEGLDQDIRYFSLPVGISFGGKKIYIASEIEGFEMMELKRMKKEIKKILELENKGNKR